MRWISFFENKSLNNATEATRQLLRQLAVPVTATTINVTLESHPDFPSLYSISDTLKKWKVESIAMQTEAGKLNELPVPFIAHLKNKGGYFCIVTGVKKNIVWYVHENGKIKGKSRAVFLNEWSGVALLAEASERSGEKNYKTEREKEVIQGLRLPFIITCFLCLISIYTLTNLGNGPFLLWAVLAVLKLAGCFVTSLLLWAEVDKANPVLQQICSGTKNTNCNAVLSSKGAKLFSLVSGGRWEGGT